jgi:hypothetical protein
VYAAGLALLAPTALRASCGEETGRHWVYSVERAGGRLVRIGDQSTPPLDPQLRAPVAPPGEEYEPAVQLPPSPPGDEGKDAPADAWPRGRRLTFYAGGGFSERTETSCGGPTHFYRHRTYLAGLALGREAAPGGAVRRESWQLRLGVYADAWDYKMTDGSGAEKAQDVMVTAAGFYQWDWRAVGLGAGAMLGLGSSKTKEPLFIPLGKDGYAVPALYLRLGPPVFAFELGSAPATSGCPARSWASGSSPSRTSSGWGWSTRAGRGPS